MEVHQKVIHGCCKRCYGLIIINVVHVHKLSPMEN